MFFGKVVLVRWSDPTTIGGKWVNMQDVIDSRPIPIVSYGKVVYEDEHLINICSHFTEDGDVDGDLSLPLALVKEIIELDEGTIHVLNHTAPTFSSSYASKNK